MKGMGLALLLSTLVALPVVAASPTTSLVEGLLTSAGGGPAADGLYDVTFSIWAGQTGGSAVWSEGPVKVAVKGGRFHHALGSGKAIDIKKVGALKAQWLGVKVGTDPMLPRQKLHATLFALHATSASSLTCSGCLTATQLAGGSVAASKVGFTYAGSDTKGGPAKDLKCSGCVSVSEMKFDGNANFGAFGIKAKNGTFTGGVTAATVVANSFQGDGSKLTGIKIPSGECAKKGEVVKGINADGTLKCVAALDPAALPHDGLNEISNNLLSNQFIYSVAAAKKKVLIPDNQGTEAASNILFPNIGVAQTLEIKIAVENTDISTLSLVLLPPDDKKTGWVLCDPCGKKDTKKYAKTFTPKAPPQAQKGSGKKIDAFIGSNLQGLWTLKAKDTSFCIVQMPGNAKYCDTKNKKDGWITDWSIKMQYVSNKKVAVNGDQEMSGTLAVAGDVSAKNLKLGTPGTCNAANLGKLAWDAKYGLRACHKNYPKSGAVGYRWVPARPSPVMWSGGCKSHNQSGSWRQYCLDGNDYNYSQGHFNVSTSGRFTIAVSGFYRIKFYTIQHGCGQQDLAIRVNGVQKAYYHENGFSKAQGWRQRQLQYTAPLKIGEYVEPWTYHNGCGNQYNWHLWNPNGSHSRVTFEYIGPLPQ